MASCGTSAVKSFDVLINFSSLQLSAKRQRWMKESVTFDLPKTSSSAPQKLSQNPDSIATADSFQHNVNPEEAQQ